MEAGAGSRPPPLQKQTVHEVYGWAIGAQSAAADAPTREMPGAAVRHTSTCSGRAAPPLDTYKRGISYLWPECVTRNRMSRRLSATVLPKNSARSAALILANVALMAAAHLSMPSALG
jgi:hypothetical protein